jgi:uncharacterized protein (TIGR02271 family)
MTQRSGSTVTTNRDTVVGVFHSHHEAQKAVHELKSAGFTDDQIGVAAQDKDGTHAGSRVRDEGNKSGAGAAAGAATGLGAGALWGLGIVAGVLPAIGPVIAGGALAAIAASAAGTAVAGGLVGALVGMGIPEDEAKYYDREFEQGRTVVTVKARGAQYQTAHRILDRYNAYDYQRRDSDYATNPRAGKRLNAEGQMVAREEILETGKHSENAGEARIRKEVTTETERVDVPVQREELVVERQPLHGKETAPIRGDDSGEERVVLKEEQVDVNKRTIGKEAARVGKRTVTENQPVEAELKKERIVVDDEAKRRGNRKR